MVQNQAKSSLDTLMELMAGGNRPQTCTGLSGAELAYFIYRFYRSRRQPMVVVTADSETAVQVKSDLRFFISKKVSPVYHFPSYSTTPFKLLSYHQNIAAQRISTLYQMMEGDHPSLVITTIEAILGKVIPKPKLLQYSELILEGEELDREMLIEKLIHGGYTRSVLVEEPGDFCVRGGILDIFSPIYSDPIRIEMYGDFVESLRLFSPTTQRTLTSIDEAVILPASEAIIENGNIDQVTARLRLYAAQQELSVTRIRELVSQLKTKSPESTIEGLLPIIYQTPGTFFDFISESAICMIIEPSEIALSAEAFSKKIKEGYETACSQDRLCVKPNDLYLTNSQVKKRLISRHPIVLKRLAVETSDTPLRDDKAHRSFKVTDNAIIKTKMAHLSDGRSLFQPLSEWIQSQQDAGISTVIVCHTKASAKNLRKILAAYRIQPFSASTFAGVELDRKGIWTIQGQLSTGFAWPEESLAVITEDEIFDTKSTRQKRPRKSRQTPPITMEDLNTGDLIVHDEHGIGRYEGLVKLTINGSINDFLLILYKDEDRLYLPVDRMGMIEKYMGVDSISPTLDKMGGQSWARIKAKVKRSAEKIAGKLLEIYAARKVHSGFSFNRPVDGYGTFTALFAFEETPDQHRAIEDVLRDMSRPTPMDRLVCGDVGYGKTEVALRAAYVAADNGKQVAIAVPTTVLAEQHFSTFSARFKRTPFNIACLSRFRSKQHQREIINRLKTGRVDIIIGTHRLFSKDVEFAELGLVILDEEQRFGVKHKEKLKRIRTSVDVLALTATPIPRTLHLSMTGVRDISIISTPPEYRRAIVTHVCEFDDAVVTEAIRREHDRNGQIYFVHNDIASIEKMAGRLNRLVPEVRVDVAHGRMTEDVLEDVMRRFANHEIDMLVCTTIIESGLDIPAANTMLINRAGRLGLAQIYQLRGRVGRSDRQAYAYLLISHESQLTKAAKKRLKVLMTHSDLGSGFQIAMHDLKIRGGGTILGASQSGHIAAVGYDMFLKLMKSAVDELKGDTQIESLEPEVNFSLAAFIPEDYIPDIDQRLTTYRRLAKMKDLTEMKAFRQELKDRFGQPPEEMLNLLVKIMLRVLAIQAGVKRLDISGKQLILYLSEPHQENPAGMTNWFLDYGKHKNIQLSADNVLTVRLATVRIHRMLAEAKNILKEMIQHVNS
jgi:transcription-repair coupling factor (superfamily II helicase)